MKKIHKLLSMIILLAIAGECSAQEFIWGQRAGQWGYDYGKGVCTDDAGNIYMTGKIELESWFDDNNIIKVTGNHDIFLAKYDRDGKLLWVRNAGGPYGDYGHDVVTDKEGNVYMIGEIDNTVTFYGTNEIKLNSWGSNDIFVAKYSTDGEVQWAHRGGGRASDKGQAIAIHNDAIYVTGYFRDTASFNNDGAFKLFGVGSKDIFVGKYNLDGKLLWLRSAGGEGEDEGWGITTDENGFVYVTGFFVKEAKFGNKTVKAKGGYDGFLAKYDPEGNVIWVKNIGSSRTDKATAVKAAKNGKIYVTGGFRDKLTVGNSTITSKGDMDIFVACFTSDGDGVWAKSGGGELYDTGLAIDTDDNSDVYITGFFAEKAEFSGKTVVSPDSADIFVAKYSSEGELIWLMSVDGKKDVVQQYRNYVGQWETEEAGRGIVVDKNNFVIVSGSYRTNADFVSFILDGWTNPDIFLAKIRQAESKDYGDDTTTTVMNLNAGSSFEFYPNPSDGKIRVSFSGVWDQADVNISVRSLEGKTLFEQAYSFRQQREEFLNLEDLAPGLYLIELSVGHERIVKKMMIRK